jgi:hypothetical protein
VTDKGTAELALGSIEELCEGSAAFESGDEDWVDEYLPLLAAVESGINRAQEGDPDHLKITLATNSYSKKEVIGALRKMLRSVKRHHAVDGAKGYLKFIKDKV